MKTVAIVCEYNPFHNGHFHQIQRIYRDYGEEVCIVAVMSGNFTQRGELAVFDKYTRAKAAVAAGVSLVLELPFPYAMQSAEIFARAGVYLATAGVHADVLSFGSECGNTALLQEAAKRTGTSEFTAKVKAFQKNEEGRLLGHPRAVEAVYRTLYGDTAASLLASPNDTLAIEYIKALQDFAPETELHTFARVGADHNEAEAKKGIYASASAIRGLLHQGAYQEASAYLPSEILSIFEEKISAGKAPVDTNRLSNVLLAFLRIHTPEEIGCDIADCNHGLLHRLRRASLQVKTAEELFQTASTKRYTHARLRRAVWNAFFGITSAEQRSLPHATQVLAMDKKGAKKLKEMQGSSSLEILTKPADHRQLSQASQAQLQRTFRADEIYFLAEPHPSTASTWFAQTPYCKK